MNSQSPSLQGLYPGSPPACVFAAITNSQELFAKRKPFKLHDTASLFLMQSK